MTTQLEHRVAIEHVSRGTMTRLVSRAIMKVRPPKCLSKPDAILARDVVEVVMPLASLVLMALLVNHGVNALANRVDDVMTIQRANLVTMTKLMLLMKPELLRCQFSFDDFLADEAVVGDGDVIGMLMSLASL